MKDITIHVSYSDPGKETLEKKSLLLFQGGAGGLHCHCLTTATTFTVHIYIYHISRKRASSRLFVDPSSTVVPSGFLFTVLPPCLIYFAFSKPSFFLAKSFVQYIGFFPPEPSYSVYFTLSFACWMLSSSFFWTFLSWPYSALAHCAWILINMVRSYTHPPWSCFEWAQDK